MREYAEIIPIYEQRWAERPDSLYFVPLANAYRTVGQHHQAIETLQQGLERHPDYLGAQAALALAYFSAGLREEAEEEIQRVLAAQPDNLLIRRLLVACHQEAGREEEAQAEARRIQGTPQPPKDRPPKEAEEVPAAEAPPVEAAPSPSPEGPKGLELGPALEAFVDDANAVKEIQGLFTPEPPPEEEVPADQLTATLEGWLGGLERRRG